MQFSIDNFQFLIPEQHSAPTSAMRKVRRPSSIASSSGSTWTAPSLASAAIRPAVCRLANARRTQRFDFLAGGHETGGKVIAGAEVAEHGGHDVRNQPHLRRVLLALGQGRALLQGDRPGLLDDAQDGRCVTPGQTADDVQVALASGLLRAISMSRSSRTIVRGGRLIRAAVFLAPAKQFPDDGQPVAISRRCRVASATSRRRRHAQLFRPELTASRANSSRAHSVRPNSSSRDDSRCQIGSR